VQPKKLLVISVQSNLAHLKKYRVILKRLGVVEKIGKIEKQT